MIILFLMISTSSVSAESDIPPRIIMLEISGVTPQNDILFKAIRAQLSATSVQLERLAVDYSQFSQSAQMNSISTLAAKHNAMLLFWIENDDSISTIFYYAKKEAPNPRIHTRVLDLAAESRPSRFDAIGNAVSSIVEESLSIQRNKKQSPAPVTSPPPPPRHAPEPGERLSLHAAYAGYYFDRRTVTHGLEFGVGVMPVRWAALTISYTHSFPLSLKTNSYHLKLQPKIITSTVDGRISMGLLEIRIGLAWSVDIRAYNLTSASTSISPRRGQSNIIHSIVPSLTAIFSLSDMIGVMTGIGANIAINKKKYKILRTDDDETLIMDPFRAKLNYKVGLIVQL